MEKTKLAVCSSIVFMLVVAAFSAGCTATSVTTPGITGTYVNQKNPDESIEIHSDGSFYYMTSKSNGYRGKWDREGTTIRLNLELMGMTLQLKQKDNTLVMSNNYGPDTIFVKQ